MKSRWQPLRGVLLALLLFPVRVSAEEDRSGWFVRAKNHTTQELLTLGRGGAYQSSAVANGVAATRRGSFSRRGNLLLLGDAAVGAVRAQLLVVDWGKRRFLVEPSRVASFCAFAWRARGQSGAVSPEMVFHRPMDADMALPTKLPVVCTERRPIDSQITIG